MINRKLIHNFGKLKRIEIENVTNEPKYSKNQNFICYFLVFFIFIANKFFFEGTNSSLSLRELEIKFLFKLCITIKLNLIIF